jgi:hypothetical protein
MKRPYIVVEREQAKVIRGATQSVEVRGPDGKVMGYIDPPIPEVEIARLKKRLAEGHGGRCYTTREVLDYLKSLDQSPPGQRPKSD